LKLRQAIALVIKNTNLKNASAKLMQFEKEQLIQRVYRALRFYNVLSLEKYYLSFLLQDYP